MSPDRRAWGIRRTAAASVLLAIAALVAVGSAPVPGPATARALSLLPIAVPDTLAMKHDRTAVVPAPGVLANDINLLGGGRAALDSPPSEGSLDLNDDGGYTYTPDAGFVGTDVFWYHIDGLPDSGSTAVTITVANVVPVANPDTYAATAGVERRVDKPGVLANDTDLDGDVLAAHLVTSVAHGTLELGTDGEVRYTASTGYVGTDTFTYRAWDGVAWSPPTIVTFLVTAPTPAPTALPTPIPSPLVSLLPTLSPTPSATPSPTGTRSATGTPHPSPSAEPSPSAAPSRSPSPDVATDPPGSAAPGRSDPPVSSTTGSGGSSGSGGDDGDMTVAPPRFGSFDGLATGSIDLGAAIELAVPALVLTVPGILIVLAVLAQSLGAAIWLPVLRRWLGGIGVRQRDRPERRGA